MERIEGNCKKHASFFLRPGDVPKTEGVVKCCSFYIPRELEVDTDLNKISFITLEEVDSNGLPGCIGCNMDSCDNIKVR